MKARCEVLIQISLKKANELGLSSVYIPMGKVFDEASSDESESKTAKFLIELAKNEQETALGSRVYSKKITIIQDEKIVKEAKPVEAPAEPEVRDAGEKEEVTETPKRSKKTAG